MSNDDSIFNRSIEFKSNFHLQNIFFTRYMQDAAIKVAPLPLSSKQFDFRNLEKLKSYYDAFSGPNSMRNIMGAYVFI